jgi:hypothetical protein
VSGLDLGEKDEIRNNCVHVKSRQKKAKTR